MPKPYVLRRWTEHSLIMALVIMLFGAVVCNASTVNYTVARTIGAGSVTGFIQTDGTFGVLQAADFTDWNLLLNDGTSTFSLFGPLSGNNSVVYTQGNDVSASSTQLLFNFSGTDNGLLLFQQGLFSGNHYYCSATQTSACFGPGETVTPINVFTGYQFVDRSGNVVIGTAGGSTVPEPGTLLMFGLGIAGLAGVLRRRINLR